MKRYSLLAIIILSLSTSPLLAKGGGGMGMKDQLDNLEQRINDVSTLINSVTGNPNDLITQRLSILERRLNEMSSSSKEDKKGMKDMKGSMHSKLTDRLDTLEQRLNQLMSAQTGSTMSMTDDSVTQRLNKLELRLNAITTPMRGQGKMGDSSDQRLSNLERRLNQLNPQSSGLGTQHDIMVTRLDKLEQNLDDMQELMDRMLQSLTEEPSAKVNEVKNNDKEVAQTPHH